MRLFVSYAHENLPEVRQISEILTTGGHTVWFDDQLLPGQDWKQELGQVIGRCDALVYALSTDAVKSEWCQWEFATAVRCGKAIMPVLLEIGVILPDSLQRLQYADLSGGITPMSVAKLMRALAVMQSIPARESPELPETPKGIPSRAWQSARHWTDIITTPAHQPQSESEEVVGKFVATLWKGVLPVEGRLILTNQRILFETHKLNVQQKSLEIPIDAIEGVMPSRTIGVIPNGVTLRCQSGESFQFAVWGRTRIIALVEQCRKSRRA